jgi:glutamine amidotransferase
LKVGIINYKMGNLKSVYNALTCLGNEPVIITSPKELDDCSKIILPGVGAFGQAMENLTKEGWVERLHKNVIRDGKLFLGICLGMQLVATLGTEFGNCNGLDWIKGTVQKLESSHKDFKLPHIGWNTVRFLKKDGLYKNMGDSADFYFVNSFAMVPEKKEVISGLTDYFSDFVSSIENENIYATQYHPEKSQKAGFKVFQNFLEMKG